MSDGTIMYFCTLCGGSVEVDALPEGWDADTSPFVCETCLPVLALPLTKAQCRQVVAWVWENLAEHATYRPWYPDEKELS
jgi:hypothetical protein